MFCNVTIDGTSHGSQTDLNGMYTLARIPGGEHKIVVTFIGYKKLTKDISLNTGQILTYFWIQEMYGELIIVAPLKIQIL